jgi:hypothetical protein
MTLTISPSQMSLKWYFLSLLLTDHYIDPANPWRVTVQASMLIIRTTYTLEIVLDPWFNVHTLIEIQSTVLSFWTDFQRVDFPDHLISSNSSLPLYKAPYYRPPKTPLRVAPHAASWSLLSEDNDRSSSATYHRRIPNHIPDSSKQD